MLIRSQIVTEICALQGLIIWLALLQVSLNCEIFFFALLLRCLLVYFRWVLTISYTTNILIKFYLQCLFGSVGVLNFRCRHIVATRTLLLFNYFILIQNCNVYDEISVFVFTRKVPIDILMQLITNSNLQSSFYIPLSKDSFLFNVGVQNVANRAVSLQRIPNVCNILVGKSSVNSDTLLKNSFNYLSTKFRLKI